MVRRVAVIALALVLLASAASAQEQKGRGRGGFGGPGFGFGGPGGMQASNAMLVGMPEVQTELGLSDEQKKEVGGVQEQSRKQMQAAFGDFRDFRDLSQEERDKRMAESRKKMEEANAKADWELGQILSEKQLDRLGQLLLQRQGVAAFNRAAVAEKLGLTEDQKAKIKKIQEDARPRFGGAGGEKPSPEDFREMMTRAQKQREKMQADLLAVLTDEQKQKWTEMKGKEFKFPQPQFGGGFGGGKPGERRRPAAKKSEE